MNKQEYTEQKERLLAEMKALTEQYIEDNKLCSVGDNVTVTSEDWNGNNVQSKICHVSGIIVGYANDIEYKFLKLKKDGTPSMHTEYIWNKIISIELLNP